MDLTKTLVRNVLAGWASTIIAAVVGLIMVPYVIHHIGDKEYGIWVFLLAVVGYGGLLDLGVRQSLVVYVSEYWTKNDREGLSALMSTALAVYVGAGSIVAGCTLSLGPWVDHVFPTVANEAWKAKIVFFLLGIDMALRLSFAVFSGFLSGIQRYDISNGIGIGVIAVRTFAIIAVLERGFGVLALAICAVTANIIGYCTVYVFARRLSGGLGLRMKAINREQARKIYGFSIVGVFVIVASRIIYETDYVVIGFFMPASSVAYYAIAGNLVKYLREIAAGIATVIPAAVSALSVQKSQRQIEALVVNGSKYALLIVLPVVICFIFEGKEFIVLWVGQKYAFLSSTVLSILAASTAISMSQLPLGAMLYGIGQHKILAAILSTEGAANVFLSCLLVREYGIIGVAIGTAVPAVFVSLLIMPYYAVRAFNVSLGRYYWDAITKPILCAIPMISVLIILNRFAPFPAWAPFCLKVVVSVIVYGVTAYNLCLGSPEKDAIWRFIQGLAMRTRSD